MKERLPIPTALLESKELGERLWDVGAEVGEVRLRDSFRGLDRLIDFLHSHPEFRRATMAVVRLESEEAAIAFLLNSLEETEGLRA